MEVFLHRFLVVLVATAIAALAALFPGPGHAAPDAGHAHPQCAVLHLVAEADPGVAMDCEDCGMAACPMSDCLQEALPPDLVDAADSRPSRGRSAILCRWAGVESEVLVPPPQGAPVLTSII